MAANATKQSLWLPGFGPDSTAFPDLFADAPMAPPPPSPTTEASIVPSAGEISKSWRPSLPHPGTPSTPAFRAWPEWDLETLAGLRGSVTKFEANLTAARALKRLENEQRQPTCDERIALRRFTGWGGIPAAFNDRTADEAWRARAAELVGALSPGELESARASVNNSHYTDPAVIGWIWRALRRVGFTGGRVLEPSAGTGHFLGLMPAELAIASQVTAVELDVIAGRILRALYAPFGVDVRNGIDALVDMASTYLPRQLAQPGPAFPGVHREMFCRQYPEFDDENNLSLVLLQIRGIGFLFPGDLDLVGWTDMPGGHEVQSTPRNGLSTLLETRDYVGGI
jgi:hypothetical protein